MIVLWTSANPEPATGYTIAMKKTAQAVAVVATTMTRRTTEERQPGVHPTSKIVHRKSLKRSIADLFVATLARFA
jgi:hypothetical protein